MKILNVVGRTNHGKTALVETLVRELVRQGVRVGTIKHCRGDHELDTPGKDSFRHRQAGAEPVAVITPSLTALYRPRRAKRPSADGRINDAPYDQVGPAFENCDLVLVEGDTEGPGPKIEVWREAAGSRPLATERDDILGVVTDDAVDVAVPVWPRQDVAGLAARVQTLAETI